MRAAGPRQGRARRVGQPAGACSVALLLVLAACGGDGQSAGSPGAGPSADGREAAATGVLPDQARSSRVVVVVTIDGLTSGDLSIHGYPHATTPNISALAEESLVVSRALADSLSGGTALASVLTGEGVLSHRLGPLAEPGGALLPDQTVTLAERLQEAGWRTFAAVAQPFLAARLRGLDQGFERWYSPDWSIGEGYDANQVFHSVAGDLRGALGGGEPVFVLLHLADPAYQLPAAGETGASFLEVHLGRWAEHDPVLSDALALSRTDPEAGHAALHSHLARGRGTPQWAAWLSAIHDGQVAAADAVVGQLVDLLEEEGALEEATLAVCGLRRRGAAAGALEGQPALGDAIAHVPLLLRLAGGSRSGLLRGLAQPSDLAPTLCELLLDGSSAGAVQLHGGVSLLPWIESGEPVRGHAWTVAPDLGYLALRGDTLGIESSTDLLPRWTEEGRWLPGPSTAGASSDAASDAASDMGGDEEAERLAAIWAELSPAAEVRVSALLEPEQEVLVDWRALDGRVLGRHVAGPAVEVRRGSSSVVAGRARLSSTGSGKEATPASLTCTTSRRDLPLELTLEGVDEGSVDVGAVPLRQCLLPRLPDPAAEEWPDAEELPEEGEGAPAPTPVAELQHLGDSWWRLSVSSGSEVEALLVLHPPRRLEDQLEWSALPGVEVEPLPGRLDALRIRGAAPLEIDVKKTTQRDLALGLLLDGEAPDPRLVRFRGRRMAADGRVRLYLPDWLEGVTGDLSVMSEAPPAAGRVRISREGWTLEAPLRRAVPVLDLPAIRRLGAAE